MKNLLLKSAPLVSFCYSILLGVSYYLSFLYSPRQFHKMYTLLFIFIFVVISYYEGTLVKKLYFKSLIDESTKLKNKAFFNYIIEKEIKKLKRKKDSLSLAIIDVDNFKSMNDNYGHLAGDELIWEISQILKSNVRSTDTVIRWGGDEFAIIFPNTDINTSHRIEERIRSTFEINKYFCKNPCGKMCPITLSIGVVSINRQIDVNQVISLADKMLYKAKDKKNIVEIFSCENEIDTCA